MLISNTDSLEVLSPAGSFEHIQAAIAEEADAIYIGIRGMSARPDMWSFDIPDAIQAAQISHNAGKRIYFAINAGYAESEGGKITEYLKQIKTSGCDALIVGDWGLLKRLKDMGMDIPVHSSTMLGINNIAAVRLLEQMGVHRVTLNTNLFLDEIAVLTHACPDMEFELIACGGICFNDNFRCSLPHTTINGEYKVGCKLEYSIVDGYGNYQPGSISIHAADLDLASTLGLYIEVGITSFKIEGRTRPTGYVSKSIRDLRQAIDSYTRPAKMQLSHYVVHPADTGTR